MVGVALGLLDEPRLEVGDLVDGAVVVVIALLAADSPVGVEVHPCVGLAVFVRVDRATRLATLEHHVGSVAPTVAVVIARRSSAGFSARLVRDRRGARRLIEIEAGLGRTDAGLEAASASSEGDEGEGSGEERRATHGDQRTRPGRSGQRNAGFVTAG